LHFKDALAISDAHGAFYGPNGSEVGGVITVEDTGRLLINASFLGQ
jgi:hypothetical protein